MSNQPSAISNDSASPWLLAGISLALVLMVAAVFGQTWRFDFVGGFDDNAVLEFANHAGVGVSWRGLLWAFTHTPDTHRWNPLEVITHQIDGQFFGLWPGGHHLLSVAYHAMAAVLLFLALRSLTGDLWRSFFVSAVFALHPQHVEPVCWVSSRSEVLSGLFFAFTLLAYVRYVRGGCTGRRFLPVFLFLGLGLICKQMLVSVPFLLLLLDYWPLGRLRTRADLFPMVREKIPLILLSVIATAAAVTAQSGISAPSWLTLPVRLANAPVACMAYLRDYFRPLNLTTYYPLPEIGWPWPLVAGSLLILLGVSAVVLLQGKHRPYLALGWFWFLVMLFPVLGIVYYGGVHSWADRYTYLPQIGLSLALVWLVCDLTTALAWRQAALGVMAGLLLLAMGFLSIRQAEHWSNTVALMTHEMECVGEENPTARYYLGRALMERGSFDDAEKHLRVAAAGETSGPAIAHNALGVLFEMRGRTGDAIAEYSEALRINPEDAAAFQHLGKAHYGAGRRGEGIVWMERALGLPSVTPMMLNDLAWMLATAPEDSLRDGKRAMELALLAEKQGGGADPLILDTLAAAYAETGDYPKALETARRALELADRKGNKDLSASLRNEIALYKSGKPCRDPQ